MDNEWQLIRVRLCAERERQRSRDIGNEEYEEQTYPCRQRQHSGSGQQMLQGRRERRPHQTLRLRALGRIKTVLLSSNLEPRNVPGSSGYQIAWHANAT
jgi:hypothetical protein